MLCVSQTSQMSDKLYGMDQIFDHWEDLREFVVRLIVVGQTRKQPKQNASTS